MPSARGSIRVTRHPVWPRKCYTSLAMQMRHSVWPRWLAFAAVAHVEVQDARPADLRRRPAPQLPILLVGADPFAGHRIEQHQDGPAPVLLPDVVVPVVDR